MGVHFHGGCSPGPEVGSMGGLVHMVQQPGGHMAQLMAQCDLQLVGTVHHFGAQLHSGSVPVNMMSLESQRLYIPLKQNSWPTLWLELTDSVAIILWHQYLSVNLEQHHIPC